MIDSWSYPISVNVGEREYHITNKCDYRMVLDVITALNDDEFSENERANIALYIFFVEPVSPQDANALLEEMMRIIACGQDNDDESKKPTLMDWAKDFALIAPPVNRIMGYDIRNPEAYTHWYSFVGAYMEIGECTFNTVVSIRNKRAKGRKLEKWEQEFYRENKKLVDLPVKMTKEERDFLKMLTGEEV